MAIITSNTKPDINQLVPDQTGNSGLVLTSNGTVVSWGAGFDTNTIATHNLNTLGGELLDYDLITKSYVSAGYRVLTDNNGKVVTI